MNRFRYIKAERSFYLFLMISAYVSTLVFGGYYYSLDLSELYIPTFSAFILFVLYGILSFLKISLVLLFRLSIATALMAFFNQIYYSGGILSSGLLEFIIPPLLAFFYRPIYDRYIFMIISGICLIAIYPLTTLGYTINLIPSDEAYVHGILCAVFVFTIVSIYTFLFRNALVVKNQKIGESMKELQKTTQKLIQSEKMASLGVLSAGVAHEINNPLNFIKGGVEILEQGLQQEKDLKFDADASINVIKEGLKRSSAIVNSLNHFSRYTEAMDESCDIHEILDNCLVMLQPKLKYKGEVVKEYANESLTVKGNEGKLHQAFLNLLSNAEQAIKDKGIIRVSTKKLKRQLNIEIADDGEGISKENLAKISDPFFTTKPVGKGTGLGLSITYKIIEEHKGRIKVESKVGKGTKFTVTFKSK